MPPDDPKRPDPARLREIVADCLEQMELTGSRAVEEACALHPELAPEIRRRLGRLRELGFTPAGESAGKLPATLGDFELGEPIGAGGMGVVYHARQRSLSRDVALKVIRPELRWVADTQSRFRREIEAVSRLQHPAIVQIHAVGEEQGIPYFAMEYIPGCTVASLLERLKGRAPQELTGDEFWSAAKESTATKGRRADTEIDTRLRGRSWFDTCAWVAQQAAVALDHAHRRGVLHRDIKPQNVMVTPEGRVVVMDFGLAHTEGSKQLTRTGAALGSLIYMAPEQVRGRHDEVHETTDVYGLGVTLYEMLTLQPAFGAGSEQSIRQAILDGDFPPPRARVPSLPWDVETVCLVAMEKEPRRRYASAAAFAEDLERLLQRRSIDARRASFPLRARRWIERHPALSVAMLLMLVLTATSIAFAFQQRDANRATERALEDVRDQSARAQRNLERAQTAIDLMLNRFADTHLKNVPQFEQIRRSLLEDAVALQQGMLSEEGDDPAVRLETADAYSRLSAMQQLLGDANASVDSIAKALQIREELLQRHPDDLLRNDEIALGHHDLGNMYRSAGDHAASERHFRHAIELSEASLRKHPGGDGFTVTLVRSLNDIAITLTETARPEEAIASCRRAFELIEPLALAQPKNAIRIDQVAASLQTQAPPLAESGRLDEAVDCLTKALPWRERLVALDPRDLSARRQLGLLHYQLSFTLRQQGEVEEAASVIDDAIEVQRAALRDYPSAAGTQWDLAQSLHERGMVAKERLELEEAVASLRESVRTYEPLVAAAPDVPGYAHELAWTLSDLAACRLEQGELAEAGKLVQRAIELQTACAESGPTVGAYQERLLDHFRVLRDVCLARKDERAAAAVAEQAATAPFEEPMRATVALFRAATLARASEPELALRVLEDAAGDVAASKAPPADDPDLAWLRARPEFAERLASWPKR